MGLAMVTGIHSPGLDIDFEREPDYGRDVML